jgi:hypothetical protein
MLNLERPRHTLPSAAKAERTSHPDVDPTGSDEVVKTDDNRTLAVMKSKKVGTS